MKTVARILTAAVLAALSVLPAGAATARQGDDQQAQAPRTRLELLLARERNSYPAPDHQQAQAPRTRLEVLLARERNSYPPPDDPIPAPQQAPARPDRPLPLLGVLAAVGLIAVLGAVAAWGRWRAHLREAT
jgi:septum formation topological specificity factor MinE